MNDPQKIIREDETEVSIPPVDFAWKNMKRKLDQDSGDKIVYWWRTASGKRIIAILAGFVLLLIGSVGGIIYYKTEQGNRNNNISVSVEQKRIDSQSEQIALNNGNESKDDSLNRDERIANRTGNISITDEKKVQPGGEDPKSISADVSINPVKRRNNSLVTSKKVANKKPRKETEISLSQTYEKTNVDSTLISNSNQVVADLHSSNSKSQAIVDSTEKNQSDSSESPATEPITDDWVLESGLHWTLPVPATGSGTYFMGPNGKSQPYRLLLPGLWLQARVERHLLTFELNPFASSLPPQKSFRTINSLDQLPDTIVTITDNRTVLKTFGISGGMGYQYNIIQNWWLGSSFQASYWTRGVAESESVINKVPVGNTPGTYTNSSYTYTMADEWSYFNRFQLNLNADAVYRRKNWQAVLRLGFSFSPFAKQEGPVHPFRGELMYRWRLFELGTKKSDK